MIWMYQLILSDWLGIRCFKVMTKIQSHWISSNHHQNHCRCWCVYTMLTMQLMCIYAIWIFHWSIAGERETDDRETHPSTKPNNCDDSAHNIQLVDDVVILICTLITWLIWVKQQSMPISSILFFSFKKLFQPNHITISKFYGNETCLMYLFLPAPHTYTQTKCIIV